MTDPADLSATEAARAIAAGRLSAAALTEACLARAAAREPVLRAFVTLDPAQARAAAAIAPPGPLHGLPIGVKDVLDTAELPSQYGSPIWAGHRPRADAAAVALAKAAGGVVIGKTVTTEFATRHPGPTTNPHDPQRTPGGSSQGSAAGVAAGLFPLAFGTQTAGSILRPAAYCGVAGFKPSHGLIHRGGMKVMSESLDTIGVFGRAAADCALFAGALTGQALPAAAPDSAPRIALCFGPGEAQLSPETLALLERVATACAEAGAGVTRFALGPALEAAQAVHPLVMNAETRAALAWERAAAPTQLTPGLRERMDWAGGHDAAALATARQAFAEARAAFASRMAEFDILLTAAAPGEAPLGLEVTGDPICNALWTALHGPCISLPAGRGPAGMPLGIQLVAPQGQDAALLAWAAWVERHLD